VSGSCEIIAGILVCRINQNNKRQLIISHHRQFYIEWKICRYNTEPGCTHGPGWFEAGQIVQLGKQGCCKDQWLMYRRLVHIAELQLLKGLVAVGQSQEQSQYWSPKKWNHMVTTAVAHRSFGRKQGFLI